MGRYYSTRGFFQQVPDRLTSYFEKRELFGDLGFVAMKPVGPDELLLAWSRLPDSEHCNDKA